MNPAVLKIQQALDSFVGKPIDALQDVLSKDHAVICPLRPTPKGWPRLWKKVRRSKKAQYLFKFNGQLFNFLKEGSHLPENECCAMLYQRTAHLDYVPLSAITLLNGKTILDVFPVERCIRMVGVLVVARKRLPSIKAAKTAAKQMAKDIENTLCSAAILIQVPE